MTWLRSSVHGKRCILACLCGAQAESDACRCCRGLKDAKTPLYAVMLANLSNLLMDVLFVYGFNMGAAGAALATSISQMLSCAILFSAMRGRCDHTFNIHACSISKAVQKFRSTFSFWILPATQAAVAVLRSAPPHQLFWDIHDPGAGRRACRLHRGSEEREHWLSTEIDSRSRHRHSAGPVPVQGFHKV